MTESQTIYLIALAGLACSLIGLRDAYRKGTAESDMGTIHRNTHPIQFWLSCILSVVVFIACLRILLSAVW